MKKIGFILLFPVLLFAAIDSIKELEILSLPYKNQIEIFKADTQTYKNLLAIAKDSNIGFSKRWKAISALTDLFKEKVFEDLNALSYSKEWFIKNAVVVSLERMNHPQKVQVLKRLLKDPSLVVRSSVVESIQNQDLENFRDDLWDELHQSRNFKNNQSLWIRKKIIKYLSLNPKNHEKKLFQKLLQESEQEIIEAGLIGAQKVVLTPEEIKTLQSEKFNLKLAKVKSKFEVN